MGAIFGAMSGTSLRARVAHAKAAGLGAGQMQLGLMPQTRKIFGYVRDAVLIGGIIAWGFYVFANPDKVDAFLNWMIGRP